MKDVLAAIGAGATAGGVIMSFFQVANPILQFVSLIISSSVGLVTFVYFIKKISQLNNKPKE